jgi:23S rRNA pseudouridine1911/1915/1917 synthase
VKNSGYIYPDHVSRIDEGLSVASFYARRYPHSTEDTWRQRIQAGQVSLNGRMSSPDETLAAGDLLVYHRPPWEEPDVPADFSILHEDKSVLVLAKPSGLPVLPGGGFLENTLLRLARRRFGSECSPLHRLGRGTSGAILFTRNVRAARILAAAMAERRIRKIYLALASGLVRPDAFSVDAPIGPVLYRPLTMIHAYRPDGRPSISHVRVIRRHPDENVTLVEVTIPTGRPHQIRIHLSYAGFPLFGDPLYISGGTPRPDIGKAGEVALPSIPGRSGFLIRIEARRWRSFVLPRRFLIPPGWITEDDQATINDEMDISMTEGHP